MKPSSSALRLTAAAILTALVAACASAPAAVEAVGCAGWREIVPTLADVDAMSDRLAVQIDAHNRFGAERGCW